MAFARAGAGAGTELAKIREEIQQMKQTAERRIETLEKRLADAEAKLTKLSESATRRNRPPPQFLAFPVEQRGAFNPAVSLILCTYARTSRDPNTYSITGFVPSGAGGPPKRFDWAKPSSISPLISIPISSLAPEGGVTVEEALPDAGDTSGFNVRRTVFSGIGYQSCISMRTDAPLVARRFSAVN